MIPEIKKKRMMITDMKNEKGVKIKPVEQLIEQDDLHTVWKKSNLWMMN